MGQGYGRRNAAKIWSIISWNERQTFFFFFFFFRGDITSVRPTIWREIGAWNIFSVNFLFFLFFSFARGESDKAMYAEYLFDQKS